MRTATMGIVLLLTVAGSARGQAPAPTCFDSIPDTEMGRAIALLTTWRADSTSPSARVAEPLVDLYAQSIAQEVRVRLGSSADQLPQGEPRLSWQSGGKLRVIARRDGRVSHVVIMDSSSANRPRDTRVALLIAEAVDSLVARDERFGWVERLEGDSVELVVSTSHRVSLSTPVTMAPTERVAFPVFTIGEPAIHQVVPRQTSGFLRYPASLRAAGVEGEVVAEFVVGLDGRFEKGSFRDVTAESMQLPPGMVGPTQAMFAQAVREALPSMTFRPAMLWHCPVRQLVRQPFTFSISSDDRLTTVTPLGRRYP